MKNKLVADITPGEILAEEFLKPMGISQYRLALDIGVPPPPHQRDRQRRSGDHRQHGAAPWTLFPDGPSVLVELADTLRSGTGASAAGPAVAAGSQAVRGSLSHRQEDSSYEEST